MQLFLITIAILFLLTQPTKTLRQANIPLSQQQSQSLKGILALLIVCFHLRISMGAEELLRGWGNVIVAMFFFLSSYGLTARFVQQGQNYFHGYLRRRIWGVLFPFIIATLLYVTLLAADRHDASLFVKKFIDMATGTHTALPYSWFVFAIVIFYALFYVVFRLIKASMRVRIIICALCLAAYTAAFCLTGQGRGWWYTGFAFLAGMLFRLHEARLQSFYRQHICHILLPPVACAIIWALFQTHLAVLPVLAFVLIPTLLALLLSHFDLTRSAPLRFLGNISYEIYLMHGVWIVLLRGESVYINSTAIYVTAVFAATVASAWVLHLVSRR